MSTHGGPLSGLLAGGFKWVWTRVNRAGSGAMPSDAEL